MTQDLYPVGNLARRVVAARLHDDPPRVDRALEADQRHFRRAVPVVLYRPLVALLAPVIGVAALDGARQLHRDQKRVVRRHRQCLGNHGISGAAQRVGMRLQPPIPRHRHRPRRLDDGMAVDPYAALLLACRCGGRVRPRLLVAEPGKPRGPRCVRRSRRHLRRLADRQLEPFDDVAAHGDGHLRRERRTP
ncbi:hypothetical protein D3C83_07260 [compost metagenome]